MPAIVVIPARYSSTRFPGKPLALLKGIPVIQHVYQNSLHAKRAAGVIVATDSETIFEKVLSFGGKAVMTSPEHESGTDRIAEAAQALDYDIIVNVQGDEPLIRSEMIDEVIAVLDDARASIGTLAKKITDPREIFDPNVVKVVFDESGHAFYFSRAPIPYHRDEWRTKDIYGDTHCYKHIGIYSFRRDALLRLTGLAPSRLEKIEKLEQLRALEHGFTIKVNETSFETYGVDTPEDLERIEQCLNLSS
ncbi:MAG: 3-deoxy-manno-octulosonate cytidylyltransferase [Nitrospirae bacterium]|nr:3-deoxy-manno-octulosonate cytidylyltransferase [Nitrospirota bacterium]